MFVGGDWNSQRPQTCDKLLGPSEQRQAKMETVFLWHCSQAVLEKHLYLLFQRCPVARVSWWPQCCSERVWRGTLDEPTRGGALVTCGVYWSAVADVNGSSESAASVYVRQSSILPESFSVHTLMMCCHLFTRWSFSGFLNSVAYARVVSNLIH